MKTPPQHLIEMACEASRESPCQSKRGVVIFDGDNLVSQGHNYQPKPFRCDGSEKCKMTCGKTAVHAEQHALLFAGRSVSGCDMLHAKTVNGSLVESMGPSCLACSKLMLAAGIKGMWLYHAAGWRYYGIVEFHWLSASGTHLAWNQIERPGEEGKNK